MGFLVDRASRRRRIYIQKLKAKIQNLIIHIEKKIDEMKLILHTDLLYTNKDDNHLKILHSKFTRWYCETHLPWKSTRTNSKYENATRKVLWVTRNKTQHR